MNKPITVDAPKPAGLSRSQRIVIGCLLSPVVVVILAAISGLIGYWIYSSRAASQLKQEMAAVRDSGAPLNAVELHTAYHAEPKRAETMRQLLELSARIQGPAFQKSVDHLPILGTDAVPPPPGQEWPELAEVEALLAQHDSLLQLVTDLSRDPGAARFPIDLRRALDTKLNHLQALRATARLLLLKFHAELHRGRTAEALNCVQQQFVLAELATDDPLVISHLVCIAINGVALKNAHYALEHADIDEESLQELQATLRRIEPQAGLRTALQGERAIYFTVMSLPTKEWTKIRNGSIEEVEASAQQIPSRASDATLMLISFRRLLAANETSLTAAIAEGKQLEAEFQQLVKSPQRLLYVQTLLLMPALPKSVPVAFARSDASRQSLDALIAAIRFRRANGNWPTALAQLVPEYLPKIPLDPYSGSPLLIRSEGAGFKVYSVGENQLDDGGKWSERELTDVGFALTGK